MRKQPWFTIRMDIRFLLPTETLMAIHIAQKCFRMVNKEMFGLCRRSRTTEDNYSKVMHDYAREHQMDDQYASLGSIPAFKRDRAHIAKGKPSDCRKYWTSEKGLRPNRKENSNEEKSAYRS